jgi:tetratricopeptide (TPR) repeat protein
MKKLKYILFALFIIFSWNSKLYSQVKFDSLSTELNKAQENKKVEILNAISMDLKSTDPAKAKIFAQRALVLAEKIHDVNGKSEAYYNLGRVYFKTREFKESLSSFEKALYMKQELKDKTSEAGLQYNIGMIHHMQGNLEVALKFYQKALDIEEKLNNKENIARAINGIGVIYMNLKSYDEALKQFNKALKTNNELGNKAGVADAFLNIGITFQSSAKIDSAIIYYEKALVLYQEINYTPKIALSMNNLGVIYKNQKKFNEALLYFKKPVEIYEQIGDKRGLAQTLGNIGVIYNELGNYEIALNYVNQSLDYANELGLNDVVVENYAAMYDIYKKMKNFEISLFYHEKFFLLKDSLYTGKIHEQIAEMQTKYETDKKDKEILSQKKDKELQDKEIERQRMLIILFVGVFVIIMIFLILLIRLFNQKKKANIILELQKEEILFQKDQIEEQKKEMTDSILYARRIQHAVLPPDAMLQAALNTFFILNKPRDIVSGDFYWATVRNNEVIVAAADCTGHGVPGAFMSMLGTSSLNEIVNKNEHITANEILNKLRANIINSLHQTGKEGEQKDGMDIALCIYNKETFELQYAGANNPIYVVRPLTSETEFKNILISKHDDIDNKFKYCANEKYELVEVKADKMPIGIYAGGDIPFTNNILKLEEGDTVYIFSDGFPDQFGGEKGKKFKYQPFKDTILQNHDKSMAQQRNILDKTIVDWMGKREQIDDILIIGFQAKH